VEVILPQPQPRPQVAMNNNNNSNNLVGKDKMLMDKEVTTKGNNMLNNQQVAAMASNPNTKGSILLNFRESHQTREVGLGTYGTFWFSDDFAQNYQKKLFLSPIAIWKKKRMKKNSETNDTKL